MDDPLNGIKYYSKNNIVDQTKVMRCLIQLLIKQLDHNEAEENIIPLEVDNKNVAASNVFSEATFLICANEISPIVGLQAYKLLIELYYRNLIPQLNNLVGNLTVLDNSLQLGSFRSFPGSHSSFQ
jgi:hypothetical protein